MAQVGVASRLIEQQARSAQRAWRTRLPAPSEQMVLVDELAVGMIVTARDAGILDLIEIALLSDWRGLGIGSVVLEHLLRVADGERRTLRVFVYRTNPRAHAFYRRFGFDSIADDDAFGFGLERPPASG